MKQFLITVAGVLVGLVLFLFIGPFLLFSMLAASVSSQPAQPAHMVLSLDLREPMTDQRGAGFPRVVNGVVDMGALESPVLAAALPCKLDMDGDNQVRASIEGLVLLRSMLGFSGAAVVNGTGISLGQWDSVRNNLNTNCGTSFAP